MAAPVSSRETSETLEEELASQPGETKIAKEENGNQLAYSAQISQASGLGSVTHDEGQVLMLRLSSGCMDRATAVKSKDNPLTLP